MASKEVPEYLLLAEDDEDDYLIFTLALKDTRLASVLTRVENGDELMAALQAHQPDILFLDLDMPCKDGRQCIKEIRSNAQFDDLPVIIYSSYANRANINYCEQEGATRYMVKPGSITELTGILQKILVDDWKKGFNHGKQQDFVINPPPLIL